MTSVETLMTFSLSFAIHNHYFAPFAITDYWGIHENYQVRFNSCHTGDDQFAHFIPDDFSFSI